MWISGALSKCSVTHFTGMAMSSVWISSDKERRKVIKYMNKVKGGTKGNTTKRKRKERRKNK
jgi:hypothetical protein